MAGILSKSSKQSETLDIGDVHRIVLDRQHDYMLTNLIFDPVHDHLVTCRVFDDVTLADMKEEPKTSGKIRFLLEKLKKSSQRTYLIFKQGLRKTLQDHLADRLKEEEGRVVSKLTASAHALKAQQAHHQCSRQDSISQPMDIPLSPITQPTPSIHGSPGMHDIHEKDNDGHPLKFHR